MERIFITREQRKIFTAVGIVAILFALFVVFVYLPDRQKLIRLKEELRAAEAEIARIKNVSGEGESLEKAMESLRKDLVALDAKFPDKEELILRELSVVASRLGIEVSALRPKKKRAVTEMKGVPVSLTGYTVQEMSVSMSLRATYKKLGEFFAALSEDSAIFVRVNNVNIQKIPDNAKGKLNAEVGLDTYLMIPLEATHG